MADLDLTVAKLRAIFSLDSAEWEDGIRKVQSSAQAWSKDLQSIGTQATAIGTAFTAAFTVPIVAGFASAAMAAIDFESSFAGVKKTVDATNEEFDAMALALRQLATEIPINVNELNRLAEAAGALGIPKEEIVDFARVMAELGVTTNVTADQAAEAIAKIQNIFGAAGQETENFASTLVALGNAGASTESQILEMATRIAAAGNTIGLTQGEVLGFASALASVGLEAEAGGTAISRTFIEIGAAVSKGGTDLQNFAAIAGMAAGEFSELFKADASAAILAFVDGLGKVKDSGGDLIATLEAIGVTEVRQRDTLLRLAGAGDILRDSLSLQADAWRDNTALSEEARKRFETTEAQLTLLWNRIKDVGITLGNALLPAIQSAIGLFNQFLPVLQGAAEVFASLPGPVQLVVIGIAGLVAAIGPALIIFGQMATGAAAVASAFTAKGIATRVLALELPLLGSAANALSLIFIGLANAIAVAAAAFTGWKLGEWLGEATGATDKFGVMVAQFGEFIGLLPEGTTQQYGYTAAARQAREAQEGQAGAIDMAAEAAKRLREQIGGEGLVKDMQTLQAIFSEQIALGPMDPGVFDRLAQAAKNLQAQGQQLTPELAEIVKQFDQMHQTGPNAGAGLDLVSESARRAAEEIKQLANQMSGQGLIDAADKMVAALKNINLGEVPEAMRKQANDTIQAAIDVLRLRGDEIPAEYQRILDATLVPIEAFAPKVIQALSQDGGFAGIMAVNADAFKASSESMILSLQGLSADVDENGQHLLASTDNWQKFGGSLMTATPAVLDAAEGTAKLFAEIDKLASAQHTAALQAFASGFSNLGSAIGGDAGNIITSIGGMGEMLSKFAGASDGFLAGAAQVAAGVANVVQATGEGSTAARTLSGAMEGMAAGFAIGGPWGAAIGAGAGAIVGAFRGMAASAEEHKQKLMEAQEGVEEWANTVARHFDETASEFEKLTVASDDMAKVQFVVGQAFDEMGLHADLAAFMLNKLAAAQTQSPEAVAQVLDEINDLLEEHQVIMQNWAEGVSMFSDGLNTFAEGFGLRMQHVIDLQNELDQARADAPEIASDSDLAALEAWRAAMEAIGDKTTELNDETDLLKQQYDALGLHALQAFSIVLAQSGSLLTAMDAIGPSLDLLIEAQTKLGFEGSTAIDKLLDLRKVITANEDVMLSLEGLVLMMEGLAKAALLTKEDMDLFGKDALTAFDTLIARGVPMNQALLLMQPTLQALWEAQQKFGEFTDATTQALIDQALQMGIIGPDQKGIFEQIHDVLLDMVDAINRLPEAFQTSMLAARGFGDELERLSRIPMPGTEYAIDPATGQPRQAVPRGSEPTGGGSAPAPTPVPTTPGGAVPRGSSPVPTGTTPSTLPSMPTGTGGAPGGMTFGDIHICISGSGNPNYDGEAAALAFLRALERGGDVASLYRRVHHQLVDPCECT